MRSHTVQTEGIRSPISLFNPITQLAHKNPTLTDSKGELTWQFNVLGHMTSPFDEVHIWVHTFMCTPFYIISHPTIHCTISNYTAQHECIKWPRKDCWLIVQLSVIQISFMSCTTKETNLLPQSPGVVMETLPNVLLQRACRPLILLRSVSERKHWWGAHQNTYKCISSSYFGQWRALIR